MTITAPPPPEIDDVPGVNRRHRPSDLYHERTNFQFIKHSRRWLIISSTLIVLSLLLLFVRGLNLGIDFEGEAAEGAAVSAVGLEDATAVTGEDAEDAFDGVVG